VEEVMLPVVLVEEGSGAGTLHSLPEVDAETAPLPYRADVSSAGRTIEGMVREEPPPCEVVVIAQEEASAIGGEVAGTVSAEMVSQELPAPLALMGAVVPNHGGRGSPSLAQMGGDLPAREGTLESRDPVTVVLALGDEVEDVEWWGISEALFATLGALAQRCHPELPGMARWHPRTPCPF
jgi:hypothetical protein